MMRAVAKGSGGAVDTAVRGDRTAAARGAVAGGLLLGLAGDQLVRAPGEPGLNVFLWALGLAGGALVVHRRRTGRAPDQETFTWLGIAVLCALGLAWRDAPALKLLALGGAAVAFSLAALQAGLGRTRRSSTAEYITAVAATALHTWVGAVLALHEADIHRGFEGGVGRSGWRRLVPVVRGAALALPLLIVFGGLFSAADAVFADLVAETVQVDADLVVSHLLAVAFIAWIGAGYLRGYGYGVGAVTGAVSAAGAGRPRLGMTETAVVLGLVNALFLVFVVVQFRYLFGGSTVVEVTPGLTYAEYARRGFFELVFAVLLTLPVLLGADALLRRRRVSDEYVFRALAGAQVLLVLAITASAFERMRLYRAAYGLTEQRLYATALLMLVVAVLFWFAVTVLRGQRRRFAFGAALAGFAWLAALYVMNPDALITRTNTARAVGGSPAVERFDAGYATTLSADAVPVLLTALPQLPEDARCAVARRVLRRWGPDSPVALRTWSLSGARARAAVGARAATLQDLVARCESDPAVAVSL
jgi:hypothetical protein